MQKTPSKSGLYTLKYWLRFTAAFIMRFKAVLLFGAIGGIFIFLVSGTILPRFFADNAEVIGLTGRYSSDELPISILDYIGEGLTRLDTDGLPAPALAESWETPDKGKTWVFHLDINKKWQDGSAVKSQDVEYNFADVVVERPDAATIVFNLSDAFSPFPSVVSRPVFKSGFLGTGAWRVENVQLAGSFVQNLTMSDGINKKVFKFYPSEEGTKLAYKMGHVESIAEVIDPKPLDAWPTAELDKKVEENKIVTVFYNNEDDIFTNKDLRQALDYAIDKDAFDGERAISPIPPGSWVYNPQVKPYNFNQERARELLEGVKLGDVEIKLVASPALLSIAESIRKNWEEVGVKSIIQVSSVVPSDFQAYLTILDVPKDPDQYLIWHSTQKDSTNVSKFGNVRVDKLLEDGRLELSAEARRTLYLDFQRFLLEELPAAFLYHPVTYTITRK